MWAFETLLFVSSVAAIAVPERSIYHLDVLVKFLATESHVISCLTLCVYVLFSANLRDQSLCSDVHPTSPHQSFFGILQHIFSDVQSSGHRLWCQGKTSQHNWSNTTWLQSKCFYILLLMFQARQGTVFALHDSRDRRSLGMLWVPTWSRQTHYPCLSPALISLLLSPLPLEIYLDLEHTPKSRLNIM